MTPSTVSGVLALVLLGACSSTSSLPSEVTAAHVRYQAATSASATEPGAVQTVLTLTNIGVADTTVELSAACPFRLEAFTRSDRSGSPAWSQNAQQCAAVARLVRLAPGDANTFDLHTSARSILGDSLPAARYYFAVQVTSGSGPAISLEAGALTLGR